VIVIALFALRGIASYFSIYSLHWVANRVVMDLRAAMFRRLLALPARYFDAHSTGGLVSRFTYDVAQLRLACTEAVTAAVRDSLYVAGLLVWMLYVDWRMTLAVLLVAPVITLVVVRIRHRLRTMNRKVQ